LEKEQRGASVTGEDLVGCGKGDLHSHREGRKRSESCPPTEAASKTFHDFTKRKGKMPERASISHGRRTEKERLDCTLKEKKGESTLYRSMYKRERHYLNVTGKGRVQLPSLRERDHHHLQKGENDGNPSPGRGKRILLPKKGQVQFSWERGGSCIFRHSKIEAIEEGCLLRKSGTRFFNERGVLSGKEKASLGPFNERP